MDKIIINNLHIYAYHGVNEEERRDGQNFYLDITAFLDASVPCVTDRVEDTVSYSSMIKKIVPAFTAEKYDLIEKAAQVVADCVLDNFEKVQAVEVTLRKPEAPVKAGFGYVAVQIRRERNG